MPPHAIDKILHTSLPDTHFRHWYAIHQIRFHDDTHMPIDTHTHTILRFTILAITPLIWLLIFIVPLRHFIDIDIVDGPVTYADDIGWCIHNIAITHTCHWYGFRLFFSSHYCLPLLVYGWLILSLAIRWWAAISFSLLIRHCHCHTWYFTFDTLLMLIFTAITHDIDMPLILRPLLRQYYTIHIAITADIDDAIRCCC